MENRRPLEVERESDPETNPWDFLVEGTVPAFKSSGVLILASVILPLGLDTFSSRSWAVGLAVVGVAVVAGALGLLGLYPRASSRSPVTAKAGILFAGIGGTAALALLAGVAVLLAADVAVAPNLGLLKGAFVTLTLLMAGGFALGFLSLGVGILRTDNSSRSAGRLLVAGGAAPLVPVVGQLLRLKYGVGPPPWVGLLILGLVGIVTLAVGHSLERG